MVGAFVLHGCMVEKSGIVKRIEMSFLQVKNFYCDYRFLKNRSNMDGSFSSRHLGSVLPR